MNEEAGKGQIICTVSEGKVHATYQYKSEQDIHPSDWIALFIYNREITYEAYQYVKPVNCDLAVDFDIPTRPGYYCVRLYPKGIKPQKGRHIEVASSKPFLIGESVNVHTEYDADNAEIIVSCQFEQPSQKARKDYVCMYPVGRMSNHDYLAQSVVSVAADCSSVSTRFKKPAASGKYEFRYFFNSIDAFSGVSEPIELPSDYSMTLYSTPSALKVYWEINDIKKLTGREWVGLFNAETAAQITYENAKPIAGSTKGLVTFPKNKFSNNQKIFVRLYSTSSEIVEQSDTISL